jgi:hypothetical protein
MQKVIIFCFAGREKYISIQLQYIMQILKRYKTVEYHLWDFSRNSEDHKYLKDISTKHAQIVLHEQFYQGENTNLTCVKQVGRYCSCVKCRVGKWTEPYKYYASSVYKDFTFIKIDDDIVSFPYKQLQKYIYMIQKNPKFIVSANVINNGVCAFYNNELKPIVVEKRICEKIHSLTDWFYFCTNIDFFKICHEFFLSREHEDTKPDLLSQVPLQTKFSINTIGFMHNIMREISQKLDISSNDEETISGSFPILIYNGFTCVHFHFSDQRIQMSDSNEHELLRQYNNVAKKYISIAGDIAYG